MSGQEKFTAKKVEFVPATDAEIYSLQGLIAWLEKQPAETEYPWVIACACVAGQYLAAHGVPDFDDVDRQITIFGPPSSKERDYVQVTARPPFTFGGALHRTRNVLASRS